MGRPLWNILRYGAAGLALVVVLAGLALATSPGQRALFHIALQLASSQGLSIEASGFRGSLFGTSTTQRIAVSDARGPWLVLDEVSVSWRPVALLGGTLDIVDVTLGTAHIRRAPERVGRKTGRSTSRSLPIGIRLAQAQIKTLALESTVLGVLARLTVTGQISLTGRDDDMTGALDIRRIDDRKGQAKVSISREAATGMLAIHAAITEPAGGLIATVLESPGLPPLDLTLNGRGTLADLKADLRMESAGKEFAAGQVRLWQDEAVQRFAAALEGSLGPVVPPALRDLLAGRTEMHLAGRVLADDGLQVDSAGLTSETLRLTARGLLNLARFYAHGEAALSIGDKSGRPVRLPAGGTSPLSIVGAEARLSLAAKTDARALSLTTTITGLESGTLGKVAHAELKASARQPQPFDRDWRRLDGIVVDARLSGVRAAQADIQALLGADILVQLSAHSNLDQVVIDAVTAETEAAKLAGSGVIADGHIRAKVNVTDVKLAALSAVAGRDLGGTARITGDGHWQIDDGSGKADIRAEINDPTFGVGELQPLFAGATAVRGTVVLDADGGLRVEDGTIAGQALSGTLHMQLAHGAPAGRFELRLDALQRVHQDARGSLVAKGELGGAAGALSATLDVSGAQLSWQGKPLEQTSVRVEGSGSLKDFAGTLALTSGYGGQKASGRARVARSVGSGFKLDDIDLGFGKSTLKGWFQTGGKAPMDGDLTLEVEDLRGLSVLIGKPVAGQVTARLGRAPGRGAHALLLKANLTDVRYDAFVVPRATVDAVMPDARTGPVGTITLKVPAAVFKGRTFSELVFAIDGRPDALATFKLEGRLADKIRPLSLAAGGIVAQRGSDISVTLQRAVLSGADVAVNLIEPATAIVRDGSVAVTPLKLAVGGGRVTLAGKAGPNLAITLGLEAVPAAVANAFQPELGAEGGLYGRASIDGTALAPTATYDLEWRNAGVAQTRDMGDLAPLAIQAKGTFKGGVLGTTVTVRGRNALSLSAKGTLDLKRSMALRLRATGQAPLKIVDALLAERRTKATGYLLGDVAVSGTIDTPRIDGTVTISGADVRDPETGVELQQVQLQARISGADIVVDRFSAASPSGGRLTGGGRVGLDARAGYPVTIDIRADAMQLKDDTLAGKLDAAVSVTGAFQRSLLIAGGIALNRFDITVPERLPRSARELDLVHVNVPPERRAALGLEEKPAATDARTPIRLDLNIKSDGRIFVRGRGLDAQLGGDLKLQGTTETPFANGDFRLVRGRLAILGRRLQFNRGTIGFTGSLDPALDFEAAADADGTVITTTVTGRASNPVIKFTSTPQLPEDELLARLLFNKSLAKLSPLQIAQLASEVDRLGGLSGGPGVLDQLRTSVGVDSLDVATDKKGNAAITAGKYLLPNAYVGVQQNTGTNASRVIVDLDITKNIKAHGETGSDGRSKVGVGIEWNY